VSHYLLHIRIISHLQILMSVKLVIILANRNVSIQMAHICVDAPKVLDSGETSVHA